MKRALGVYAMALAAWAAFTTGCVADESGDTAAPASEHSVPAEDVERPADHTASLIPPPGNDCTPSTPDYPRCRDGGDPSVPGPSCSGKTFQYCTCLVDHPCGRDPSQCTALAACYARADSRHSGCGRWQYSGPTSPQDMSDCLIARPHPRPGDPGPVPPLPPDAGT